MNFIIRKILKSIPKTLKMPNLSITQTYIDNFIKAENSYQNTQVFDKWERIKKIRKVYEVRHKKVLIGSVGEES